MSALDRFNCTDILQVKVMISICVNSGHSFPQEVFHGFVLFRSLYALKDRRDQKYVLRCDLVAFLQFKKREKHP